MVTVYDRLTGLWPFSNLGSLLHKSRSSSEFWGPWTDGDSDPLTTPTIRSLYLLKNVLTAHLQSRIRHPTLIICLIYHEIDTWVTWCDQPYTDFYIWGCAYHNIVQYIVKMILNEVISNHSLCSEPTQLVLNKNYQSPYKSFFDSLDTIWGFSLQAFETLAPKHIWIKLA